MKPQEQINFHYQRAVVLAVAEVERIARKILIEHPEDFKEFVMAMGTWFFSDKKGLRMGDSFAYHDQPEYMQELETFIDEWDPYLHLTGHPMRFTAAGKITRDW